jgi:uncharacterized protein (DUF4415 family)
MSEDRTTSAQRAPRDKAEALATAPRVAPAARSEKRAVVLGAKEMVTLRIDSEVLAHFQDGGPGWQDRINEALRKAMPAPADEGHRPEDLNSSNDG